MLVLGVQQGGKRFTVLHPTRSYFRPTGVQSGDDQQLL